MWLFMLIEIFLFFFVKYWLFMVRRVNAVGNENSLKNSCHFYKIHLSCAKAKHHIQLLHRGHVLVVLSKNISKEALNKKWQPRNLFHISFLSYFNVSNTSNQTITTMKTIATKVGCNHLPTIYEPFAYTQLYYSLKKFRITGSRSTICRWKSLTSKFKITDLLNRTQPYHLKHGVVSSSPSYMFNSHPSITKK